MVADKAAEPVWLTLEEDGYKRFSGQFETIHKKAGMHSEMNSRTCKERLMNLIEREVCQSCKVLIDNFCLPR